MGKVNNLLGTDILRNTDLQERKNKSLLSKERIRKRRKGAQINYNEKNANIKEAGHKRSADTKHREDEEKERENKGGKMTKGQKKT